MPRKKEKLIDDVELTPDQIYLRNKRIPRSDAEFEWTPDRVRELRLCTDSLMHFTTNYFYINTVDDGKCRIDLYDAQKRVLRSLNSHRFVIINASRQVGKALALDTPVNTPTGWKTMGELKTGDQVFGSDGIPTEVVAAHDVMHNRVCYRITFSNGESVVADEDHRWFAESHQDRVCRRGGRVVLTKEMAAEPEVFTKHPQPNWSVQVGKALYYPEADLPIHPYHLGMWLGDGSHSAPSITVGESDLKDTHTLLSESGGNVKVSPQKDGTSFLRFTGHYNGKNTPFLAVLRQEGLYKNKHIPEKYLRSSVSQRIDILRGLMDSDGTPTNRVCVFSNTNETLIDGVIGLLHSLGVKCTKKVFTVNKDLKGAAIGKPVFRVTFSPSFYAFKLGRKRAKQVLSTSSKQTKHSITKIEPVDSVPVRCITVAAPDEQFQIGKTQICSMNTTLMTAYALWVTCFTPDKRVVIVANKEKTAINILRRIKMAYEELPNWLKPGAETWGSTEVVFGNDSSIAISTTSSSAARGDTVNCVDGGTIVTIRDTETQEVFEVPCRVLYEMLEDTEGEMKVDLISWEAIPTGFVRGGRPMKNKRSYLSKYAGGCFAHKPGSVKSKRFVSVDAVPSGWIMGRVKSNG